MLGTSNSDGWSDGSTLRKFGKNVVMTIGAVHLVALWPARWRGPMLGGAVLIAGIATAIDLKYGKQPISS